MIELGTVAATAVVGAVVVAVAAWGSLVSIRSASRGPRWALEHIASIRPVAFAMLGVGVLLTLLVRPTWAGLAVLYVGLTVLLLAALLRRALLRLEAVGGLDDLPLEQRRRIVRRARIMVLAAGGALSLIGVAGVSAGAGPLAWIPGALGITLVVTGLLLSAEDPARA